MMEVLREHLLSLRVEVLKVGHLPMLRNSLFLQIQALSSCMYSKVGLKAMVKSQVILQMLLLLVMVKGTYSRGTKDLLLIFIDKARYLQWSRLYLRMTLVQTMIHSIIILIPIKTIWTHLGKDMHKSKVVGWKRV